MGDYVFISYAREDHDFVLKLATELKDRGISVWLDQWDIPAGADWDQNIDSALRDCAHFLIILSPAAVASKQVRGELQTALDDNKPIVPVLRRACQIPRVLRLIQYVDFTSSGPGGEPTFDRLVRALHMPEAGRSPQGEEPINGQSRRLWLYGVMGGLLVLGLLFAWLWPGLFQHKVDHVPSPPSVLQGHLQVNVNVDAARVSVDGIGIKLTSFRLAVLLEVVTP
jgi:hypothetical protein